MNTGTANDNKAKTFFFTSLHLQIVKANKIRISKINTMFVERKIFCTPWETLLTLDSTRIFISSYIECRSQSSAKNYYRDIELRCSRCRMSMLMRTQKVGKIFLYLLLNHMNLMLRNFSLAFWQFRDLSPFSCVLLWSKQSRRVTESHTPCGNSSSHLSTNFSHKFNFYEISRHTIDTIWYWIGFAEKKMWN